MKRAVFEKVSDVIWSCSEKAEEVGDLGEVEKLADELADPLGLICDGHPSGRVALALMALIHRLVASHSEE